MSKLGCPNRKEIIAHNFGAHVEDYNRYAELQRDVAETLAEKLPKAENPDVLEIGCGTGFLTDYIIDLYKDGHFTISDLCGDMTAHCAERLKHHDNITFKVMDGENPNTDKKYDIIVSSMAIQWFEDPIAGLEKLRSLLKPGGKLFFTSLGTKSFQEWCKTLKDLNLPEGVNTGAELPGTIDEEVRTIYYPSTLIFLKSVKKIGAHHPKDGYKKLTASQLRQAATHHDETHDGAHTWHIVYGCLEN